MSCPFSPCRSSPNRVPVHFWGRFALLASRIQPYVVSEPISSLVPFLGRSCRALGFSYRLPGAPPRLNPYGTGPYRVTNINWKGSQLSTSRRPTSPPSFSLPAFSNPIQSTCANSPCSPSSHSALLSRSLARMTYLPLRVSKTRALHSS